MEYATKMRERDQMTWAGGESPEAQVASTYCSNNKPEKEPQRGAERIS